MQRSSKYVLRIVVVGVMAALVFAASNVSINFITIMGTPTRIHLGNIMCLLSGLLFAGTLGGLSAGIGSCFFDLFNPLYISSAPFTLVFKFLMGFVCGTIAHSGGKNGKSVSRNIVAGISGQVVYIILYLGKTLIEDVLLGNAFQTALVDVGTKSIFSLINAVLAVAIAVPLSIIIRKALEKTSFKNLMVKE